MQALATSKYETLARYAISINTLPHIFGGKSPSLSFGAMLFIFLSEAIIILRKALKRPLTLIREKNDFKGLFFFFKIATS